ncbi:MAG TPA: iron-containing alcohol dehydrogenase [Kofleriaceae bacterium]
MTEVIMAPRAVERLPGILAGLGCRHCLVVTGASSVSAGAVEQCAEYLPADHRVFSPAGTLPQLAEAMRCHRDLGDSFDGIIAIGGGRIIDTAKAIALRSQELVRFMDDPSHKLQVESRIPLVAVPTLAGSGSEVTPFAVAYRNGIKQSLSHPAMAPAAAVVDPDLTATVSPRQRAISGLDAIAHGVEALLSKRAGATSDRHARRAIEIGYKALFKPAHGPAEQLIDLCRASVSGGAAISTTRTTIPHAMSYYFTSVHGVPHGHAVALTMGRYLRAFGIAAKADRQLRRWSESYDYVLHALGATGPHEVEGCWHDHLARLGISVSLSSIGIRAIDMSVLGQHVNRDRFENSPLNMSTAEARALLVE